MNVIVIWFALLQLKQHAFREVKFLVSFIQIVGPHFMFAIVNVNAWM